jgi:hypothetical protein
VRGLGQRPSGDGHRATEHQKYVKAPTNSADEPIFSTLLGWLEHGGRKVEKLPQAD